MKTSIMLNVCYVLFNPKGEQGRGDWYGVSEQNYYEADGSGLKYVQQHLNSHSLYQSQPASLITHHSTWFCVTLSYKWNCWQLQIKPSCGLNTAMKGDFQLVNVTVFNSPTSSMALYGRKELVFTFMISRNFPISRVMRSRFPSSISTSSSICNSRGHWA